jgi:hypothetical protein
MASLARKVRRFWFAFTGRKDPVSALPEVILHDPKAQGPRDLDDPFVDPKVQSRIGDVIAKNTPKKS